MRVTMISIVIGAFGSFAKGLKKKKKKKTWRILKTFCLLDFWERTPAKAGVKN